MLQELNFKRIYFRNQCYDRNALVIAIDHLANYLRANIQSSSPFVILPMYNHIKSVIAYYAIIRINKIVVVMDPASKPVEVAEIIEDTDPAAVIFLNNESVGFNYQEEIIFRTPSPGFIIKSDIKDVCTIAYTNAEDGYSKGAMLTSKNLMAEVQALIDKNYLSPSSVTCALLPYSHLFGLIQGILVPTHAGGVGVINELNIIRLEDLLMEIYSYKVTHLYSVPSLYYLLGKVPGIKKYIQNIREFYSGGHQLSAFIFESFLKNTERKIREGYGLTETSPGIALNFMEEGPLVNSIGLPLPGCDIKIFSDRGNECNSEEEGEIRVKGDMVFCGYFNQQEATDLVFKDGWFCTGDLGKKDKQGHIYFKGLKKDMINVSGNKVYPKKLERLMKKHKNVADVKIHSQESLIQGQIVNADIKLCKKNSEAQAQYKDWCFKNISNVSLPKLWNFK